MLTLYTAIGNYRLTEKGLPLVTAGGRDCALDAHELLLWSSLAFRILTYQELKAEFYEKERELHILGELDFDHYLNRLVMRRLVASGRDCTGVDALYDLLGHLYVQPAPNGIAVKTVSFLKLVLSRRLPFRKALAVFHTEKLEPMEKQVMALLRHQMLSTAELIGCAENGKRRLKDSSELMECLYHDEDSDCDSIVTDCRLSETRFPVLTAVANLYFKQQITFQIL
ncbi:MAG: hypothetical protein NC548_47865 [Lachnospiraceae bacterium]|nr:hypothetical protein [Lachnospiraceae bacterium]